MFEYFEHTADVGIRVRAPDLPTLFEDAAAALFGLIVSDPKAIRPAEHVPVRIVGRETDFLLFDWLSELLYLFETRRLVCSQFHVRLTPEGLEADVAGEPLSRVRHALQHEIKAVTYHELAVRPTAAGWEATVIVDI